MLSLSNSSSHWPRGRVPATDLCCGGDLAPPLTEAPQRGIRQDAVQAAAAGRQYSFTTTSQELNAVREHEERVRAAQKTQVTLSRRKTKSGEGHPCNAQCRPASSSSVYALPLIYANLHTRGKRVSARPQVTGRVCAVPQPPPGEGEGGSEKKGKSVCPLDCPSLRNLERRAAFGTGLRCSSSRRRRHGGAGRATGWGWEWHERERGGRAHVLRFRRGRKRRASSERRPDVARPKTVLDDDDVGESVRQQREARSATLSLHHWLRVLVASLRKSEGG